MRVSLFGYATTTKAIAKRFKNVTFYDDKCHKPFVDEQGFKVKPSGEFHENYSDLEITSPGIAPSNPLIKKAKNLVSEYDIFEDTAPLKVWISGTNGKTTTTQMMEYLLKDRGAMAGGNIGLPLANLDEHSSIWLLETSSFTIYYTKKARPNIYILLPIKADHISWHGSFEEYKKAKLKPLELMQEGELAIVPHELSGVKTDAFVFGYKDVYDLAKYFDIDTKKIKFKGAFLLDALLAMAVDKALFDRVDYDKINSFTIDPHRQEELRDSKNRLWINDSKATNIDATIAALETYKDSFIHLILGGDDKGVDLSELFIYLRGKNLHIYNIGSNKDRLSALASDFEVTFTKCLNLKDAIKAIDKNLKNGEIAMLSPAAASLDEFSSYAHRGEVFKESIKGLL
ncbi:MAG: UDP-N-acetylmuramoyl-L-alanine--D-glutamate ligase [Sulfurimonas sp.]|jgi:UDP-N-acetylmuramoylalanine--D-glutamate ligase|nr:UDP-N-acetylmuramoyl-L-alanine--D-glutamate ligase [Sulfurimonadaceae bacterium]